MTKSAARRVNGAARKLARRVCRAFGPRDLTLTYYDLGPYSIESASRLAGVEGLDVNLPYLAELLNRAARRGGGVPSGRACSFCGVTTPREMKIESFHAPDCAKPGNMRVTDLQRAARMGAL